MTETNGFSQGQDATTSSPVAVTPSTTQSQPTQSPTEEKVFKQQEVNEIVGRAKHEAVERYKRQSETTTPPTSSQPLHQQHLEHIMSEDNVRRMAAEEINRAKDQWQQEAIRRSQEQEAQRIANDFLTKLDAGKSKFNDFDQIFGDFEFGAIPHVVQLATMVDNTVDVMYELAKNPSKIANIQQLINISPKLAQSEMQRLSKSLKDNEGVANVRMPNEPLSQMRPSNTGTDNGAMSVSDYRKKYRG